MAALNNWLHARYSVVPMPAVVTMCAMDQRMHLIASKTVTSAYMASAGSLVNPKAVLGAFYLAFEIPFQLGRLFYASLF